MSTRGRKRKPAEIRKIEGNPGKRPIEEPVVVPDGAAFVPDHLRAEAKAALEMLRSSMPPDLYKKADSFALAVWADWWAWHKMATEEMAKDDFKPIVMGSAGQEQPNPWFKILKQASDQLRAASIRLGLDPVARQAMAIKETEKPKSKFDGLIGSAKGGASASVN